MFDLSGRVALITGAASGIGAATARVFAQAGASVALAWYPPDGHDVRPVQEAITSAGGRCLTAAVPTCAARADVNAITEPAVAEFGAIDIVVANAGIARKVDLDQLDDEAWATVLDVDLNGAWRCFRAALPHMRRARYGRLLATSSVAGTCRRGRAPALRRGQGRAGRPHRDSGRRVRPGRDHRQRRRARRHRYAAGQRPGELARAGRGTGGRAESAIRPGRTAGRYRVPLPVPRQ